MTAVTPASAFAEAPTATTVYRPAAPVDMRATLSLLGRGPHDPTTKWDALGVWRTFRTPEGSATLRIRMPDSAGGIHAAAWGDGAHWAIAAVPGLLGRDDDWAELDV